MRYGNIYGSPSANGIGQATVPRGYRDVAFDYVYSVTLDANGSIQDQLGIQNDSDFAWRAVVQNSTGIYSVQFSDSDWFNLSSAPILSTNIQGDPSSPWPVMPEIIIPAGGRIGINLLDLSGAENTINFLFRGAKRYLLG